MAICTKCGRELSFLASLLYTRRGCICPKCREEKTKAIDEYLKRLYEYGSDDYLDENEYAILEKLKNDLNLTEDDLKDAELYISNLLLQTRAKDINEFIKKLHQFTMDGYLSPEEEEELRQFQDYYEITPEEIGDEFQYYIAMKTLSLIKDGELPVLHTNLLLKVDEKCHYETSCNLVEQEDRVSYEGGYGGLSFRITKGVYYRTGSSRGERIVEKIKRITDRGRLYITNKRVVFTGDCKNITYKMQGIIDLKLYNDAIVFVEENESKMKYFVFDNDFDSEIIAQIISRVVD